MVELVDTPDLGSGAERCGGSTPSWRTISFLSLTSFFDFPEMTVEDFLQRLQQQGDTVSFADTMAVIDGAYEFTSVAFCNGNVRNEAGQNNGSCKILAFAKRHQLNEQQTLNCFGDYYRVDVLENPDGDDHRNIREFMARGWNGVVFDADPLKEKS